MPVEALLFDLGGVVINIDFARCFERWAASAACAVEDVAARFTFDAAYEDHERGILDAAAYFEHLRRALCLGLSDAVLLEGWNDIYVGVDAEVSELLAQVRTAFPLYAFTNSNPSHQAVWSRRFADQLAVFKATFVSSEIGHRKPDPAAFHAVASMIGVPPSRIVLFDDGLENIDGAEQAGLQAVHVTSSRSVRDALSRLSPSTVAEGVDGGPVA